MAGDAAPVGMESSTCTIYILFSANDFSADLAACDSNGQSRLCAPPYMCFPDSTAYNLISTCLDLRRGNGENRLVGWREITEVDQPELRCLCWSQPAFSRSTCV